MRLYGVQPFAASRQRAFSWACGCGSSLMALVDVVLVVLVVVVVIVVAVVLAAVGHCPLILLIYEE
jgi:hypothetical protein